MKGTCVRRYSRHCFDFDNKLSRKFKHATSDVAQTVAEHKFQQKLVVA